MIRYALLCGRDHAFEAWFQDSDAFDRQNGAGQVVCPVCDTADVRKALMTPSVRRSAKSLEVPRAEAAAPPGPSLPATTAPREMLAASPVISDPAAADLRAALRDLHARLKSGAENVGPAFPDQARRIHDGEAPARAIYGTATDSEVRALVEDGIAVLPIPTLPDDRN